MLVATGALRQRGRENLGDVAQAQMAIRRLAERFPTGSFRFLANSPNEAAVDDTPLVRDHIDYLTMPRRRAAERLIPRRALMLTRALLLIWGARRRNFSGVPHQVTRPRFQVLNALDQADALYISGSGGFSDRYVRGVPTIWMTLILVMTALHKPVVLSGQQIGPLSNRGNRWLVKHVLSKTALIGVREPASLQAALELGLPPDKIVLTGDDAWDLPIDSTTNLIAVCDGLDLSRGFIAAQFRASDSTGWTIDEARAAAPSLDHLAEHLGVPVVFVSMMSTPDASGDIATNREVAQMMRTPVAVLPERLSPVQLKSLLSAATIAVGVSNHFLVFATSAGTPSIGLFRSDYLARKVLGLAQLYPESVHAIEWSPETDIGKVERSAIQLLQQLQCPPTSAQPVNRRAAIDRLSSLVGACAEDLRDV